MFQLTSTELLLIKSLILDEKDRLDLELISLDGRKMSDQELVQYIQKKDLYNRYNTILQKISY